MMIAIRVQVRVPRRGVSGRQVGRVDSSQPLRRLPRYPVAFLREKQPSGTFIKPDQIGELDRTVRAP